MPAIVVFAVLLWGDVMGTLWINTQSNGGKFYARTPNKEGREWLDRHNCIVYRYSKYLAVRCDPKTGAAKAETLREAIEKLQRQKTSDKDLTPK